MLTNEEIKIIKETVPLLKDEGQNITSIFYKRLFEEHPELKNVFNQTNQKKRFTIFSTSYGCLSCS